MDNTANRQDRRVSVDERLSVEKVANKGTSKTNFDEDVEEVRWVSK